MRSALERGHHHRASFRAALASVTAADRDAWVDVALGLGEPPPDGADLPRGCVPYLPVSVETLLGVIDAAAVTPSDVFVDIGSGVGRATTLVHLLTGASAIGLEIQPELVRAARELVSRLGLARVTTLMGDANALIGSLTGSVFFLYCPFSGERLTRFFANLEPLGRERPLRVCCVDMPAPECAWLLAHAEPAQNLRVYRSTKRV